MRAVATTLILVFAAAAAAAAAGGALCEAISAAVYDALLAPVVAALAPLPGLPDWAGAGSGTGVMPGAGEDCDAAACT
jgi:hypothetical protein